MIGFSRFKSCLNVKSCYIDSLVCYHPYKVPQLNSYDLALQLVKNLIYHDKGIVVFNKPYSVSFAQNSDEKEGISLHSLLPFLKKNLNYQKLYPAKVPEKYSSGVAVFCTNEDSLNRVKNCIKRMRGKKHPMEFYDCVVRGHPPKRGQFEGGITLEEKGQKKVITLIQECSSNRVRNGLIKPVKLQHTTLSNSDCASRLLISTTRIKWHSVRVYASRDLISPILGDHIFGRSVKTISGKNVLVDLFSPAADQTEKLSADLLSKLELSSRNDIAIPLHQHLLKLELENFLGPNQNLELIAQPPDYFLWTCEVLGLIENYRHKTCL